ncbi:MAG: hypothetical protein MUE96_06905 [Bacteroidia bacterium]|jgi:hypothetical protein|nr:hypothetical protein [Bacteroidia bacterium]
MKNNLKLLTLAGFVLVAGLTLSNCKDDAETPAPAQPAPTPTPTVENTLTYDNITIDSMSGACEFGTELNVTATGTHDNRTYTLYAAFPGSQAAAGTYTTVLPGENPSAGKCSLFVLRQFSGTSQSIYPPADLAVTLTIENGNYRVTFAKTKFVAVGNSSFFANISASKVGCR